MRLHASRYGLAAFCILAVLPLAALPVAAQSLGPRLQDATIVGQGSTITITRLPVETPDGLVYRDITIQLKVDARGALQVNAAGLPVVPGAAPVAVPPQAQIEAHASAPVETHDVSVGSVTETATVPEVAATFQAGTYRSGDGGLVQVANTGRNLLGAAFPTWTLTALGDSPIGSADWYSGPIRSNPHRRMIEDAGISSNAYSYGTADGGGSGHFDTGMLIGVVQNGDTLVIVSFHRHGCCTYASTPTSQIVLTKVN